MLLVKNVVMKQTDVMVGPAREALEDLSSEELF
jgi:hypothetical protein